MGNYAKFNATLAKVTVNGKKAQVVLDLNHKAVEEHYLTLVGSIDEEIMIAIGNPQMSMEDVGVQIPCAGLKATVGPGGVVEKVDGGEQLELGDEGSTREPDELSFDDTDEEPDSGAQEGEKSGDEQTEPEGDGDSESTTSELECASSEKEKVEEYILENRPAFEDIPYDFPALLEQKRGGKSWVQISSTIGVKSRVLSIAWREYKGRVEQQMIG